MNMVQLLEPSKGSGAAGTGFNVPRTGNARVALIGFPSVGKSSLLSVVTGMCYMCGVVWVCTGVTLCALAETESLVAAYEFTTLTCIPGNIMYRGTKIQLLDLPGIIEGITFGKSRRLSSRLQHSLSCC